MMKQNLHIITLGVFDMKKTRAFYEDGLGWKASKASQGDIVFFDLNGMALAFYPWGKLAEDAKLPEDRAGFRGLTLAYNTKTEKEVDQILAKARQLGAKIIKSAEKTFWGGYSGYFEDPNGHLFEVAHNPFATFDERGNIIL